MKDRIELFIEQNCNTCDSVLGRLLAYAHDRGVELHVYNREHDRILFERRQVFICPATFVNERLVFYGDIRRDVMDRYLGQVPSDEDHTGVV